MATSEISVTPERDDIDALKLKLNEQMQLVSSQAAHIAILEEKLR